MKLVTLAVLPLLLLTACGDQESGPDPTPTPTTTATPLKTVIYTFASDDVRCTGADEVAFKAVQLGPVSYMECEWVCGIWFGAPKHVILKFSYTAPPGENIQAEDSLVEECASTVQTIASAAPARD